MQVTLFKAGYGMGSSMVGEAGSTIKKEAAWVVKTAAPEPTPVPAPTVVTQQRPGRAFIKVDDGSVQRYRPTRNSLQGFRRPSKTAIGQGTRPTAVGRALSEPSGPPETAGTADQQSPAVTRRVSFSVSAPEICPVPSKRKYDRTYREKHYSSQEMDIARQEIEHLNIELFPHTAFTRSASRHPVDVAQMLAKSKHSAAEQIQLSPAPEDSAAPLRTSRLAVLLQWRSLLRLPKQTKPSGVDAPS